MHLTTHTEIPETGEAEVTWVLHDDEGGTHDVGALLSPASQELPWELVALLYEAGYSSRGEALAASDEDLLEIKGFGKKSLERLRG
jgi:DNA-directed RNA polymerase alpha subunit